MQPAEGLRTYPDLVAFQIHVAERWIDAARQLRDRGCAMPEFEFVAHFGAFNALYWLWGVVADEQAFTAVEFRCVETALAEVPESLRKRVTDRMRGPVGEHKLIDRLVASLDQEAAGAILNEDSIKDGVKY